jgi:hypothetical protein
MRRVVLRLEDDADAAIGGGTSIGGRRWCCDGEGGGNVYACVHGNGFIPGTRRREGKDRMEINQ